MRSKMRLLICVLLITSPSRAQTETKRTVLVLPGIMGSVLRETDSSGSLVWVNTLDVLTSPCDKFAFKLALDANGSDFAKPFKYRCIYLRDGKGVPLVPTGLLDGYRSRFEWIPNFYGDLINSLRASFDVRPFPYDWRKDYSEAVEALRMRIEHLTKGEAHSVDIIAHSQGGLIAELYLRKYNSDPRVRTVIFLGTPHEGAPKSYAILLGWQAFEDYYPKAVPHLYFSTVRLLTQNFPATYELLPRSEFYSKDGRQEPLNQTYQRLSNQGLVALAKSSWKNTQNVPSQVHLFAINGSGNNTLRALDERTSDGCIVPEDDPFGDGTVPLESAKTMQNAKVTTFYVNGEHGDLPDNPVVYNAIRQILDSSGTGSPNLSKELSSTAFSAAHIRTYTCGPLRMSLRDRLGRILSLDTERRLISDIPNTQFFHLPRNDAAFLEEGTYAATLYSEGEGPSSFTVEFYSAANELIRKFEFLKIPANPKFRAVVLLDSHLEELEMRIDAEGTGDFTIQRVIRPTRASY
jgi:pimeloyl-ACP methyl ester carboxylesterase